MMANTSAIWQHAAHMGKKSQENGPVGREKDRKNNERVQKNMRDSKVETSDSSEIPDRGDMWNIPDLPSVCLVAKGFCLETDESGIDSTFELPFCSKIVVYAWALLL